MPAPALAGPARPVPDGFAELVRTVLPAVVSVNASPQFSESLRLGDASTDIETAALRARLTGSGFVIDPSGIILTNEHVVGTATEVPVTFDDQTVLSAKVSPAGQYPPS